MRANNDKLLKNLLTHKAALKSIKSRNIEKKDTCSAVNELQKVLEDNQKTQNVFRELSDAEVEARMNQEDSAKKSSLNNLLKQVLARKAKNNNETPIVQENPFTVDEQTVVESNIFSSIQGMAEAVPEEVEMVMVENDEVVSTRNEATQEAAAKTTKAISIDVSKGEQTVSLGADETLEIVVTFDKKTFRYTVNSDETAQDLKIQVADDDGMLMITGIGMNVEASDTKIQYSNIMLSGKNNTLSIGANRKFEANSMYFSSSKGGSSYVEIEAKDDDTPDYTLSRGESVTFTVHPHEDQILELTNPFDNKKYRYYCEYPVKLGDKVYVEGKKAGEKGIVVYISDDLVKGTAAKFTLNVVKAFGNK